MPRVHQRKTKRGLTDISNYKQAYEDVKAGYSLRGAAKKNGLNHISLMRYIRKRDAAGNNENQEMGFKSHNRVFTPEQEREITKYLTRSDISSGLTRKDIMKLVYELSVKYDLSRPRNWDDNKMAGEEWCRSFVKRNPEISVRAAKATSLAKNENVSNSTTPPLFTSEAIVFTIKLTNSEHKNRKSTNTDAPTKEDMRREYENRLKPTRTKRAQEILDGEKTKRNATNRKETNTQQESSLSAGDCVVCMSAYSESRPGENWIQCTLCKMWAHEECTTDSLGCVCYNCVYE